MKISLPKLDPKRKPERRATVQVIRFFWIAAIVGWQQARIEPAPLWFSMSTLTSTVP